MDLLGSPAEGITFRPKSQYMWLFHEYESEISEKSLIQISKDLGAVFVQAESDDHIKQRLQNVLSAVVGTAGLIQISQSHRAAACNVLCGYLIRVSSSPAESVRASEFVQSQWLDLFDLYLEQSVNSKAKPMKQVLVTLSATLRTGLDPSDVRVLHDLAVTRIIRIIWGKEVYSRVKPAMQALAYFIIKRVILLQDFMTIFMVWWRQTCQVDSRCEEVLKEPTRIREETKASRITLHENWDASVIAFALGSLHWISQHDLASAAGYLASTYFQELYAQASDGLGYLHSVTKLPLWVAVLQRSDLYNLSILENFKHYVLPSLFFMNTSDFRSFLESLGLEELQSNSYVSTQTPSAVLLLASLEVGKALGLISVSDAKLQGEQYLEAEPLALSSTVLDQLLTRPSAATRCSALTVLITSTSRTRPFTMEVLSVLKHKLPCLHADTDAHFRNEVLSLEQQLFDRLRGAISYMTREEARQQTPLNRKNKLAVDGENLVSDPGEFSLSSHILLGHHVEFLNWYVNFLMSEIRPAASYQRHIAALNSLAVALRSGLDDQVDNIYLSRVAQREARWPLHVAVYSPSFVRALLDLLLDPFDDVRDSAAVLLRMLPATYDPLEEMIGHFLVRAQSNYRQSGRADHANGLARGVEIMYPLPFTGMRGALSHSVKSDLGVGGLEIVNTLILGLERNLAMACRSLASAVSVAPVHGELSSLSTILDRPGFYASSDVLLAVSAWRSLHQRIVSCCETVWQCVREVLCNDSPEGLLLEDTDPGLDIGTKDILSWAWRALKESSTLARVMVNKASHSLSKKMSILESSEIRALGSLTFDQLTQLRHRGALSVVSMTYAVCCQRCSHSDDASLAQLPSLWYYDTLKRIRNEGATVTRRSAGIPSLIIGILTSDSDGDLIKTVILDLQKEACIPINVSKSNEDLNLTQVHALNCLKAIFTNAKLVPSSQPFVPNVLRLAISCFGSEVWAIRNCGMMLFQALLDRLTGVGKTMAGSSTNGESQLSGSLYEQCPGVIEMLVGFLGFTNASGPGIAISSTREEYGSSSSVEAVFPALEIIRRAGIPTNHADVVKRLLLNQLGSSTWQIRVAAAKTICEVSKEKACASQIASLLDNPWRSTNFRHGNLLCVKYVLLQSASSNRAWSPNELSKIDNLLLDWYRNVFVHDNCPYTQAAFLDVINTLVASIMRNKSPNAEASNAPQLPLGLHDILINQKVSQDTEADCMSSNAWAATSLIRRESACAVGLRHSLWLDTGFGEQLTSLARRDPDSAGGLMDMMATLDRCTAAANLNIVTEAYVDIIKNGVSATVSIAAATNLANFLETKPHLASASLLKLQEKMMPPLENPVASSVKLRLRASAVAIQRPEDAVDKSNLARRVTVLSRMLKLAGDDLKDFPTRYAAVQSLHAIRHDILKENPIFLNLLLILYDTLNDDDEDIRDKGAEIASKWLRGSEELSLMPILARDRLLEFLMSRYRCTKELWFEALFRLVSSRPPDHQAPEPSSNGSSVDTVSFLHPANLLFEKSLEEDTSLFVEEKQNLFVDEIKEAESWSFILKRCDASTIEVKVISAFQDWIEVGLSNMLQKMQSELDGPLGWTTKPEVFLLGFRFMLGGAIILHWAREGVISDSEFQVRTALEELAIHGRRNGMNGFWLRLLDSILATSG